VKGEQEGQGVTAIRGLLTPQPRSVYSDEPPGPPRAAPASGAGLSCQKNAGKLKGGGLGNMQTAI